MEAEVSQWDFDARLFQRCQTLWHQASSNCGITALFAIFLETNKSRNFARLWCPIFVSIECGVASLGIWQSRLENFVKSNTLCIHTFWARTNIWTQNFTVQHSKMHASVVTYAGLKIGSFTYICSQQKPKNLGSLFPLTFLLEWKLRK